MKFHCNSSPLDEEDVLHGYTSVFRNVLRDEKNGYWDYRPVPLRLTQS